MAEMADMMLSDRNLLIAREVVKISQDIGRSPAQVALNWIRQQDTFLNSQARLYQ